MDNKTLCIVIPMKDPTQSKQRLLSVLKHSERQSLAMMLFEHTLAFLREHFANIDVLVVTPSKNIATLSHSYAANSLIETSNQGLNHALEQAAQWCIKQRYRSQLILPADIVNLDLQELQQLINSPKQQPSVTICPASDQGTNALLTSPPNIIPFCYGQRSSIKHQQAAAAKGISATMIELKQLAFDLDTPSDYQRACQHSDLANKLMQNAHLAKLEHVKAANSDNKLQRAF